ncbi:MAG: GGDEF domain-containing protein [Halobacteriovoraceae bacterium]|nr:GGDEF domain-containing protein [Halobacteriovoraceae bacterium]
MADDSTIVLKDIKSALGSAESEAKNQPPALLIVGGDLNGTLFDLLESEITAGRNSNNQIQLEFGGISRNHFKIVMDESTAVIEDLGSKNGTFVNNKKINGPTTLEKGDMIKIGSIALKYLPKGDPERLTYDKLKQEANTDKHTGCFNKAYFNKALENEISNCKATGHPLSLIIFDLDHFKHLNDNFGHDAGDFVLKELAELIRANGVRELDIFARYGGEEFVILLPKTNIKNSFEIAERLRVLIEKHQFIYEGKEMPVTASIGLADYRKGVKTGTDLFKRADESVYQAKKGGRNQVKFYRD